MLKNNGKVTISKYFLFSLLVICLVFTAIGFEIEHSCAVEVNQSSDETGMELYTQDKLENSQDNDILEVSNDEEILTQERLVTGDKFEDIQRAVDGANPGDTIKLSGYYSAGNKYNPVLINKKLTFTATSGTTLDGQGKSLIFWIGDQAVGSVISNLKFINGDDDWGSAIRIGGKNVTVYNCAFENNHCCRGGAIVTETFLDVSENLVVKKCNFTKNYGYQPNFADYSSGAAVSAYGMNSQIIDCIFDSNWVKSKTDAFGGAIQIGIDDPSYKGLVSGCTFKNNAAILIGGVSHGGAGCVRNGVDYVDCLFINNTAGQGGALTMHASGNIINCMFINNTATEKYGGAISTGFLYDTMVLKIADCTFEGNSAPEGGAIQAIGQNVEIKNSKFNSNHADTYGGAVTVEAANVAIKNSGFENNIANVDGGAVFIKGVNTIVEDSSFVSNSAIPHEDKLNDGLGGAIYVNSTKAQVKSSKFMRNTARNGSAIYYDGSGESLNLTDNVFFQNQAWVYHLPISTEDIYYGDREKINVVIYGGNNIADFDSIEVSNAIYNDANNNQIEINGENPVDGATNSGKLYQDSREYNINILLTVQHEDGTVVYNDTLKSSYLGDINVELDNLKPGKYNVAAKHFEDTYYKAITNVTSFRVNPKVDNQIVISSDKAVYDFDDVAVWTINVTNAGPNDATEVYINNILPEGLEYFSDTSAGLYNPTTGILNVSTMDVGEKLSFDIVTIIHKTGVITNKANVTSFEFDTNDANNLDECSIRVNPACDIRVTKIVNNKNPNYGDKVNWTIVIRNNGPDIAHNISVKDILPDSLVLESFTGRFDSKSGTWDIESLGVNEEIRLNLITTVAGTGIIENNASAYAMEYDHDPFNNHDDEVIEVDSASDLSIVKSVNATSLNYHDLVKWTLVISNNGPDDATGVNVTDVLPGGFTYIDSTWKYANNVFEIGSLAVGQVISIDMICRADAAGNYTNFAGIKGSEYDFNLTNNVDNESVTVNPACDLEITKSVNESKPVYGQSITWTVKVKNNGPDVAHNVGVWEVLPDSLIWIDDDSLGDYNHLNGLWNIEKLAVGQQAVLKIVCQVNKTGLIVNNVNVTGQEFDYNLTNNHDNESVDVEATADVAIVKLVNNTNPNYNDLIRWTIIVSNNGPDKATSVEVDEKIPDGMILVESTPSKGIYDNGLWLVCCLENGDVETLEIVCRVNRTGDIINNVKIKANEYDPDYTNNNATKSVEVTSAVDIEVIHDVDSSNPLIGKPIVWMITVKNNGPDVATEVELKDLLPESLKFVKYDSTRGKYADGIWDIGKLDVGGVEYLNITCVARAIGTIINDASATSAEYDWNESNNYDDATINVLPVADLVIDKFVDNANPKYGDLITWTLRICNNGPNDAANVIVTDSLPNGLEFICSSDDGNYNGGNWFVGNLKSGQIKELTIQCKVISTGFIKNTADVIGDIYDPNIDNNHAESAVSIAPASDLSVTKLASRYKYVVGDVIEYMIEIVNNGPDTAYNIKVNEILDDLLKLKSFKLSRGEFDRFTKVWTIDSLGYGESARLYIKVIATGPGIIKNQVSVTSDSFDYDMSNNKDFAIVNVTKNASNNTSGLPKNEKLKNAASKLIVLQKHPTANPIAVLVLCLAFSLIIFRKQYLKEKID